MRATLLRACPRIRCRRTVPLSQLRRASSASERQSVTEWPTSCTLPWNWTHLDPSDDRGLRARAVILLNGNFKMPASFATIWSQASIRVCADGGARRFHDLLQDREPDRDELPRPHVVVGDFDSVGSDVLDYWRGKGSHIFQVACQDSTDLEKSLEVVLERRQAELEAVEHEGKPPVVLPYKGKDPGADVAVFGAFGGNFSHELGHLHILAQQRFGRLVFVCDDNVCFMLGKGRHRVHVPIQAEVGSCSLVPIMGPTSVTTTGLRWNLDNATLSMGELVSVSNQVLDPVVTVSTSQPILWVMDRRKLK